MLNHAGQSDYVSSEDEISLQDLWQIALGGLPFVLLVALGAMALTYVLTSRIQPTFRTTTTILANRGQSSSAFGVNLVTAPALEASAYRAAAKSHPVLTRALEITENDVVPLDRVRDLADSVDVRAEQNAGTTLLRISATSHDPVAAASYANAVANAMLEWDLDRATNGLETVLATLEEQISAFDAELGRLSDIGADTSQIASMTALRAERIQQRNAAKAMRTSAVGHLEILESALVPLDPFAPRPLQSAALGLVLGLALATMLIFIREALDPRFRRTDELARSVNLPLLAEFPRLTSRTRTLPISALAYLRTNLLFATTTDYPKVILVSSPGPGQGKTSIATGLAQMFATSDYKTLLIDADMRRPRASSSLITPTAQFCTVESTLSADSGFAPVRVCRDGNEFDLLPTFEPAPSPTELISSSFAKLLTRVKSSYDVVIIDCAPLLPVADALIIAPHVTGVLLAVSMTSTHRKHAHASIEILERAGCRILGLVATNLPTNVLNNRSATYGYGYGSYGPKASRRPLRGAATPTEREPGTAERVTPVHPEATILKT